MVHTNWDPICHVASDGMLSENTWQVMDNLLICWSAKFIHCMTLIFGIHRGACTISQLTTVLERDKVSPFLHSKAQGTKFDLEGKIGQGQHRVTI